MGEKVKDIAKKKKMLNTCRYADMLEMSNF